MSRGLSSSDCGGAIAAILFIVRGGGDGAGGDDRCVRVGRGEGCSGWEMKLKGIGRGTIVERRSGRRGEDGEGLGNTVLIDDTGDVIVEGRTEDDRTSRRTPR